MRVWRDTTGCCALAPRSSDVHARSIPCPIPRSLRSLQWRLRQHCNGYTTGTGHQARPLGGFSVHPEACPSLYGKIAFEFFLFSWCRRLIRCPPDRSLPHCAVSASHYQQFTLPQRHLRACMFALVVCIPRSQSQEDAHEIDPDLRNLNQRRCTLSDFMRSRRDH
jgi:hypothetical protein